MDVVIPSLRKNVFIKEDSIRVCLLPNVHPKDWSQENTVILSLVMGENAFWKELIKFQPSFGL